MFTLTNRFNWYLALINRAGGLYGRILTEVVSTDRTQWGLYTRPRSRFSHTDRLSSVNKMFIIWQKQEQFTVIRLMQLVCTDWRFAWERRWAEFNSFEVYPSSFLFFLISFLALTEVNIFWWKQSMILHFSLQLFHFKTLPVRWENLDGGQYPFQPIKFVNLLVLNPCETEPYI